MEDGNAAAPRVSVVVTARDEEARLPLLLAALDEQTCPPDAFEVVVVDDASSDRTPDVAEQHPRVSLVRLPVHTGLPGGRNAGIEAARGAFIALTDADCVPDRDWLRAGLEHMSTGDADILAGGIVIPVDRRSSIAALVDATAYLDQELYLRDSYGAGANLWVRREVFARIGGFNPRVGMYGDERELCHRAVAAGARLVYAPDVLVTHPPRDTVRAVVRKGYWIGRGMANHRRFGSGRLRAQTPLYLNWKSYVPRPWIRRRSRLTQQGVRLSPLKTVGLYLGQHAFVQVPTLVGDIAGEMVFHVRGRGPQADPGEPDAMPARSTSRNPPT